MKKIFSLILCLAFIIVNTNLSFASESQTVYTDKTSPIAIEDIIYDVNKNLTEDQMFQRFQIINITYEIGQPFSEEDSEFIRAYAQSANQSNTVTPLSSVNIDRLGSANGVYGRIYGSISDYLGIMDNSFTGNLTGTASSTNYTINSLSLYVQCMAYGIVGSDGLIGLVYNKTISATGASSPTYLNKTQPYTGAILYDHVTCWLDVKYNNGSILTVTG